MAQAGPGEPGSAGKLLHLTTVVRRHIYSAVVCQEGRVGQPTHPLPRLLPLVSFLSHRESLHGRRGS